MFIIGSCEVKAENGIAQLPDAFNLKSYMLSWYYCNSTKTLVYMKPEQIIDKKTLKEMRSKQKNILIDKKNRMYLPAELARRSEGCILKVSGLADIVEIEMVPENIYRKNVAIA